MASTASPPLNGTCGRHAPTLLAQFGAAAPRTPATMKRLARQSRAPPTRGSPMAYFRLSTQPLAVVVLATLLLAGCGSGRLFYTRGQPDPCANITCSPDVLRRHLPGARLHRPLRPDHLRGPCPVPGGSLRKAHCRTRVLGRQRHRRLQQRRDLRQRHLLCQRLAARPLQPERAPRPMRRRRRLRSGGLPAITAGTACSPSQPQGLCRVASSASCRGLFLCQRDRLLQQSPQRRLPRQSNLRCWGVCGAEPDV